MLKLAIIGRLGGDPEMKYTQSGKAVANFSVAVSDGKDENGDSRTAWVKCTAWEKKAELVAEYLRKGHRVYLEGKPGSDSWADKATGAARSALTLTIQQVEFLTSREEAEQSDQRRPDPGAISRRLGPPPYQESPQQTRGPEPAPAGRQGSEVGPGDYQAWSAPPPEAPREYVDDLPF